MFQFSNLRLSRSSTHLDGGMMPKRKESKQSKFYKMFKTLSVVFSLEFEPDEST